MFTDLLRVLYLRAFTLQFFLFTFAGIDGVDVLELVFQKLDHSSLFLLVEGDLCNSFFDGEHLTVQLCIIFFFRFAICEGIEKNDMRFLVQKGLPRMLTVNMDQSGGNISHDREGHRSAVDPCDGAALVRNISLKEQGAAFGIDAEFLRESSRFFGDIFKQSGYHCLVFAASDQFPGGTCAQDQTYGVNNDGFTCARFTRKDGEGIARTNAFILDDGDIIDA